MRKQDNFSDNTGGNVRFSFSFPEGFFLLKSSFLLFTSSSSSNYHRWWSKKCRRTVDVRFKSAVSSAKVVFVLIVTPIQSLSKSSLFYGDGPRKHVSTGNSLLLRLLRAFAFRSNIRSIVALSFNLQQSCKVLTGNYVEWSKRKQIPHIKRLISITVFLQDFHYWICLVHYCCRIF